MKTGVPRQIWHMSADKIRTTEPTDMKLTFSERKFKELSENVYFHPPLMYSYLVISLSSERCRDISKSSVTNSLNYENIEIRSIIMKSSP